MISHPTNREISLLLIIVGVILAGYLPFIRLLGGGGTVYDLPVGLFFAPTIFVYVGAMIFVIPKIWRDREGKTRLGSKSGETSAALIFVGVILTAYIVFVVVWLKDEYSPTGPGFWGPTIIYGLGIILLYAYSVLNVLWGGREKVTSNSSKVLKRRPEGIDSQLFRESALRDAVK